MASISTSIELYDRMSAPLMSIMNALDMTISSMYDMQSTMESEIDTSSLNAAAQAAAQAHAAFEEMNEEMGSGNQTPSFEPQQIPAPSEPVKIPVEWVTNDLEVFTGTGIDRFQQEVASTNQMLDTLSNTQNKISQNASTMNILPSTMNLIPEEALADFEKMGQRIQVVQQRIQQIENNPMNMGTDRANAELEQLRLQLSRALQSQENLNQALENMDVESANLAYNQLSQTVSNTERYIRDNVDEQGRFNEAVANGSSAMDGLGKKVLGLVAAYASMQTVEKILDVSDELTQTTARIDMMNDGLQTTPELMNMIYQSAQNARGSFNDMAAVVAKFGNNAGDAFGSSEEVVAFANLIQKQMTIAGASTAEASNAMLQLSQALGSGTLRGDELNSIFEQAPNLIQSIADYLDVPIGKIREMASEGQLSADIVKNAIFAASDDINAQFAQIPMTWGQVWTTMKNGALIEFQPVLEKVNELANNQKFQEFASSAVGALATVATVLLSIMEIAGMVAGFFSDNWSVIEPIIMGIVTALGLYYGAMLLYNTITGISTAITAAKSFAETVHAASLAMQTGATFAATAAQYGFNAALLACPITWIIIAIIAVIAIIYAVIAAINKIQGTTISATGVIVGALTAAVAFIWNLFLGLVDLVLACVNALVSPFVVFANFLGNLFNDPIGAIVHLFGDMADSILGVLESIAKAMDKVFGSNMAGAVQGWRSGLDEKIEAVASEYGNGSYEKVMENLNLSSESLGLKRWSYTDAYNTGYEWGAGAEESVSDLFSGIDTSGIDTSNLFNGGGYEGYDQSQIPTNIANTAGNTDAMKDSMDITSEDLKYLRDIAETEVVNRFTTAEIKVEMTNNNNVSSDMDLDGMVDYLANGVNEAMEKAAEGVHE